jgi:nucleotide-binding universal stress UspA family protein
MSLKTSHPFHGAKPVAANEKAEDRKELGGPRILAVLDGSESTGLVMKYLIGLQRSQGTMEVVLLNVQPKPLEWRLHGYGWFQREAILDRLINDLGGRIVRSAGRQLDGAGVPHKDRVEIGEPVETIIRCATEEGCGLIVLTEPPPGLFQRWLLAKAGLSIGSTASVLVHLAPVPVLTVK